jgi:WD40 repeat protein
MRNELGRPTPPMVGPLCTRDAVTGDVREWVSDRGALPLVELGPDGRHVVIERRIRGRDRLSLHDAMTGGVVAELPQGLANPRDENDPGLDVYEQFAAFRPDRREIVYADRAGGRRWLRVWNVDTRRETAALADAGPPAAWSADGRMLAYATRSRGLSLGALHLWDGSTRQTRPFRSFEPLTEEFEQLAFSPDGQTLAAVRRRQSDAPGCLISYEVIGWEVATGREKYCRGGMWPSLLRGLPWFATAEQSSRPNLSVHRYDYASGTLCGALDMEWPGGQNWYGFSPDGLLEVASRQHSDPILEFLNQHFPGKVPPRSIIERPQLLETESGRPLYELPMALDREGRSRSACGWSQDGRLLAVAGQDTLAVWDVPPRKSLAWFSTGVGLIASPIVILARRRLRRLQREAAA